MLLDFDGGDEIRFEQVGRAGVVTLTRPAALNAVTHRMVKSLDAALRHWEGETEVAAIVVCGEGRAFSAGGDIQDIYKRGKAGDPPVAFFADEYRLNLRIAEFPKPYVAMIDGIVMGGGVGISFHGSHRVIGDKAGFAMPEVGIGFFPDVGGSFILPKLPQSFGRYLALTGDRIRAGDIMRSDLGTHYVPSAAHPAATEEIARTGDVDAALADFEAPAPDPQIDDGARHLIARVFSVESLDMVIDGLRREAPRDDFAAQALETMTKRSPTSLHVAFRQLLDGDMLSIRECMRMEFRILNRMLMGHDFYEGIRAAVIDKGSTPDWRPAHLADISEADIDAYFAPLGANELGL